MQQPLHTRFAPTPSGYLHVGNAYSFVLTWLMARKSGGSIRLRIDDIDAARARTEYVEDIFKSIEWLGLDYDFGPTGVDDFYKNYSQMLRLEQYQTYLDELRQQHLLFACNCSRKQITETGTDGQYSGHCIGLNLPFDGPETAWRIITPEGNSSVKFTDVWAGYVDINLYQQMRHFVVRTKNGSAAYQLASVVDDVDYNINFIVRGADLLYSTAAQVYLANRLKRLNGFTTVQFLHHGLLTDANGEKLSKSSGAVSLLDRRTNGESAERFYRELSAYMQLPECSSAQQMLQVFNAAI